MDQRFIRRLSAISASHERFLRAMRSHSDVMSCSRMNRDMCEMNPSPGERCVVSLFGVTLFWGARKGLMKSINGRS